MKIHEKRLLRGPNLYAASPCLMAVVEDGAAKAPGFAARLFALLPELPPDAAVRLADDALLVEALEPVVMELQRLAGARGLPVSFVIDREGRVATIIEGAIDWTSPYMLELLTKV